MTEVYKQTIARIHSVLGTRTQVELADKFGIRQSSISDAKRRGSIPADWLLCLVEEHGVNPAWIRTGEGARHLVPGDDTPVIVRHHDFSALNDSDLRAEVRRRHPDCKVTFEMLPTIAE